MHPRHTPKAACWLVGAAVAPAAALAADPVRLADNSQVLQTWAQSTGSDQAPQLSKNAAGETVVTFQGGVSWDKYVNSVSQPGSLPSGTMTPARDGSFYRLRAQGDLRGTSPEGDITYAQAAATSSDDRSFQSQPLLLNTLQVGRVGPGYQIALGDVAAGFSSLGTSTSLRGALLQRQFSERLSGAATAGTLADSWAALSSAEYRKQMLRDVYGAKLGYQISPSGGIYLTTQGYDDRSGSLPEGLSALAPASAHATTAGFNYLQGGFSAQGEFGASRWQQEGQAGYSDTAGIIDATWRLQDVGLRGGYHRLGAHYVSLAAQGGAGIEETYAGGDWRAATWIVLNGDLRHSRTPAAAGTTTGGQRTDSFAGSANINFGQSLPGLGWALQYSKSDGRLDAGGHNRNENYGTMFTYAVNGWNTGLGYGLAKVTSDASSATNGKTKSWQFNLGKSIADASGTWSGGAQFSASRRRQELDSGISSRDTNYALTLFGQRAEWGTINASYMTGLATQPTPGAPDLRQKTYQLDATHPFGKQNAVRAYTRNNANFSGDPNLGYRDKSVGLQLVLSM